MNLYSFYSLFLFSLLFNSCSNPAQPESTTKTKIALKSDSIILQDTNASPPPCARFTEGMRVFSNIEWIEYCLPLPLDSYKEIFSDNQEKGQHKFEHISNPKALIYVQGKLRSDESVSIEKYFNSSFKNIEEGKTITSKALSKNVNCFYAKGYWNNLIYESRFLEVTWLRNEEVITLEAIIPLADTALWSKYLVSFLTVNSTCN